MLDYYGVSESSALTRDMGYASINGNDRIDPETWYNVIGGGTAVAQYYTYSATNVRLQEVSLGYTVPRRWLGNVCDARLSLVGRNLFMLYSKAPFDPRSEEHTSELQSRQYLVC